MKKIIFILLLIILFVPISSFAQTIEINNNVDSLFVQNLRTIGFPVDEILAQKSISRYDVTRLLNAVECTDCLNPADSQINKYNSFFWDDFIIRPGEDFRDILFREAFYRQNSYYYCVAYAADNEYMNGYPIATSPICGGLFCGTNDTTKAEFLQIVMNVIEKYTFQRYSINWSEVKNRRESTTPGTYTDRYFNVVDDEIINAGIARCGNTSCPLTDRWEFKTYRKYCTFELEKCNNKTYGYLKSGRWPVAELNVLEKEGIISEANIEETIHDPIDGQYVIATLSSIFPIIRCEFNNDYDCDKINNQTDNCPNAYNPSQKDLDKDGIGNVCDPDIDGDDVKNPIGIVDDKDNIIIAKYEKEMDNCLFTPNKDQSDTNQNNIGDACEGNKEFVSLRIEPVFNTEEGALSVRLISHIQGEHQDIEWDLGDGTTAIGSEVNHSYQKAGRYTVIAKSKGIRNDAIAKTTLFFGEENEKITALIPEPKKIFGNPPFLLEHEQQYSTDSNNITTEFLIDQEKDKTIGGGQKYSKSFNDFGVYTINASIKEGNQLLAVSQYTVGVGRNNVGSRLYTTQTIYKTDEEIEFQTIIEGDQSINPIKEIERNFGDGEKLKTTSFNYKKKYQEPGRKVVIQNIKFEDSSIQQNFITIYIENKNKNENRNQSISLSATPGYVSGFEKVQYEIKEFQVDTQSLIKKIINVDDNTSILLDSNSLAYSYPQGGVYFPYANYYMNQCQSLYSQATVIVSNPNNCLLARATDTLNTYSCDLDKDGIPDICDEDIDGDGVKNELGLILFEKEDCSLTDNINQPILEEHITGICLLDNCPFTANKDQSDTNNDGIGDICPDIVEDTRGQQSEDEKDSDGDGYTDDRDACPLLPENFNGVEDADGCPEIGNNDACLGDELPNDPFISSVNCNSCPCHFADFGNTLQSNDKVRATLTDLTGSRDYTRSLPYTIQ